MKYLCLAYGDEKDWNALGKGEHDVLVKRPTVERGGSPLRR